MPEKILIEAEEAGRNTLHLSNKKQPKKKNEKDHLIAMNSALRLIGGVNLENPIENSRRNKTSMKKILNLATIRLLK